MTILALAITAGRAYSRRPHLTVGVMAMLLSVRRSGGSRGHQRGEDVGGVCLHAVVPWMAGARIPPEFAT